MEYVRLDPLLNPTAADAVFNYNLPLYLCELFIELKLWL